MGVVKYLNILKNVRWLGYGTSLNSPLIILLHNSLDITKGGSGVDVFDGVDDYIAIDSMPLDGLGVFSIEAKFSTNDRSVNRRIITSDTSADLFYIRVAPDVTGQINIFTAGLSDTFMSWNDDLELNTDYTILFTYDGTNKRIYIDGDLKATEGATGTTSFGSDMKLGSNRAGTGDFWSGDIDYMKMWSDETQTNLVAHYDLRDDATLGIDNVVDLAGDNHGTSFGKNVFTRTTTGTYTDGNGIIRTAGIDEARFEYENGSPKGILIEEQRTNLLTYSEVLDNTTGGWILSADLTTTLNYDIAPDGTETATLVSKTGAFKSILKSPSVTNGINYTSSICVKSPTSGIVSAAIITAGSDVRRFYNLNTGAMGQAGGNNIGFVNSEIKEIEQGWYRISLTVLTASTTANCYFYPDLITSADTNSSLMWGAQLEAGSMPTSYVKTEGSSVTRTPDVCSYPVADKIVQGQGYLYCEFICFGIDDGYFPSILSLSDGTGDNLILIQSRHTNEFIRCAITTGGASQVLLASPDGALTFNITHKVLVTYEDDNVKFYVDGAQVGGTDTSATIPTGLNKLSIGMYATDTNQFNGTIKNVKYDSKVISEIEAINMTRL